jgi:hypothetical protein
MYFVEDKQLKTEAATVTYINWSEDPPPSLLDNRSPRIIIIDITTSFRDMDPKYCHVSEKNNSFRKKIAHQI